MTALAPDVPGSRKQAGVDASAVQSRVADRMFLTFAGRPSDSPLIEWVWRCDSRGGGEMMSVAAGRMDLVITRLTGLTAVTVRGPETRPTPMSVPGSGEWFGIRFRPGVHMPQFPASSLADLCDMRLPTAADGSFLLADIRWQAPDFDTAETFVHRLARLGFIVRDDTVTAVLRNAGQPLTQRSVQRHFQRATGLSPGMFARIDRARLAARLLRSGAPILDVVHDAGYFDQAHLTRSLRAFIGLTPVGVQRATTQLSLLYETAPRGTRQT
jgi:AraC-like DNA-binding protein